MKLIRYWLPVIVWMGIIFTLSSRHSVQVSPQYWWNFAFFKSLHVFEYAVLFALAFRALATRYGNTAPVWRYALAFVLTIGYAISDEIHQTYVPSREGRVRDVIIDGIGAGTAWIFLILLLPKAPVKLRRLAECWGLPS